jgi:hypothetical protein
VILRWGHRFNAKLTTSLVADFSIRVHYHAMDRLAIGCADTNTTKVLLLFVALSVKTLKKVGV